MLSHKWPILCNQDEKREVVEMMAKHPCLQGVGRNELLKMAMMSKPITIYRGQRIIAEGQIPTKVHFLTSGACTLLVQDTTSTTGKKVRCDNSPLRDRGFFYE